MEKIIETRQCKHCGIDFDITDKDMEFYSKVSPIFAGKKYQIPTPTLCPDCRQQRRLAFRNERSLYRRKCDLTGKYVISIYSPESEYSVCDRQVWRSDQLDPLKYGRAVDLSQSFFQQFHTLWKEIPNVSLYSVNTINSEYANHCLNEKNCYMIFGSFENEDCMYGEGMTHSKDSMDLLWGASLESCYECVDSKSSYKLFWSQKCKSCSESYFLYNCSNCRNCIGCINSNNQSYCIENKQYSKTEYFQKLKEMNLTDHDTIENYRRHFHDMIKNAVHKYADIINSERVIGDNIESSKNCSYCFDIKEINDCKYVTHAGFVMDDVYDAYGAGARGNLMYEIVDTGLDESKVAFTIVVYQSTEAYYCINCHGCHNVFGCIGLRNKEYCILNKQYTKEEYEQLVPQIIRKMEADGERGEFFQAQMSPFGYNETIAIDYMPITREDALKQGFKRSEYEYNINIPQGSEQIPASELPGTIEEIDANGESPDFSGNILEKVIICEVSKKPFKIIRQELDFYRKHGLPLPHKHHDIRHIERVQLRNPRKIFDRKCDKCGIEIKSTYTPDREEVVYCEACYNKEVYG